MATFVLLPATLVAAHASFVDSNLVDGSVLAKSPPVAELRFSEPVLATASTVRLLHLGSEHDEASAAETADGQTTLLAEMPKLPARRVHLAIRGRRSRGPAQDGRVDLVRYRCCRAAIGIWLSRSTVRGCRSRCEPVTDGALLLGVGAVVVAVVMVRSGRRRPLRRHAVGGRCSVVVAVGWIGLLVGRRCLRRVRQRSVVEPSASQRSRASRPHRRAARHRDVVGACACCDGRATRQLDGWSSASSP